MVIIGPALGLQIGAITVVIIDPVSGVEEKEDKKKLNHGTGMEGGMVETVYMRRVTQERSSLTHQNYRVTWDGYAAQRQCDVNRNSHVKSTCFL